MLEPQNCQILSPGCSDRKDQMTVASQYSWVAFFWWLNPVRLYSLYRILYPKKEDIILLSIGYHSIPKKKHSVDATHAGLGFRIKGLGSEASLGG